MSKQPSSMCPAFGAIRNVLRMEDAMPIVISSGDGCLYGHTFVAHFYVANRPIFSPGVSSEIWAQGSMFDEFWPDISRKFLHKDPTHGLDAQVRANAAAQKQAQQNAK